MNVADNTKTIENVILLRKQKAFRSIFYFAVTSSTDVLILKSTFRILSKMVHPDKNGTSVGITLAQPNLLDDFQYFKQEEETIEIERQSLWERNRVFREQREDEKKRENEKREKDMIERSW